MKSSRAGEEDRQKVLEDAAEAEAKAIASGSSRASLVRGRPKFKSRAESAAYFTLVANHRAEIADA